MTAEKMEAVKQSALDLLDLVALAKRAEALELDLKAAINQHSRLVGMIRECSAQRDFWRRKCQCQPDGGGLAQMTPEEIEEFTKGKTNL